MAKFQRGALVFDRNVEDINTTKILNVNSAQLQFLNPVEQDHPVLLPHEAESIGLAFWIINKSSNYKLNIYDDSNTSLICTVRENDVVAFMCDGTVWKADIEPVGTGGTGAPGSVPERSVIIKTSDYNMGINDDVILVDSTSGNITIKLPNPSLVNNKNLDIKKIDNSSNLVNIIPYNNETLDGLNSKSLSTQNQYVTIITDNINWFLLS